MAYDLDEQEKLDSLRAWWERWGTLIVVLAIAIAAGILGWRGWQWYQSHQATQAMGYFEALETAVRQDNDDSVTRIQAASRTLRDDYARSGYTPRGVLLAAQALQARGDLDGAAEQLQWLVNNKAEPAFAGLARLRLAGVRLAQQQYEPALALLEPAPAAYAGLYADRRGDVLLAMGRRDDAKAAWDAALSALGADPLAQVVQLKIDALGGV